MASFLVHKKIFVLVLLNLFFAGFYAQEISVSGVISNPEGELLEGANIIAQSIKKDGEVGFTVTNAKGEFNLILPNKEYALKISYLGYAPQNIELTEKNLFKLKIVLNKDFGTLDEVVLNYKPEPIVVKVDTLVFNADDFTDGSEYKMEDLLNKLPGVKLSDGSLLVNGKEVKKVLVEGEKFFSGGTKLATENIPANAIKKVEFIDDYTDVAFMKDVSNTNKTVMNVKLKEGKKSFFFGEVDVKYGNDDFYDANPTLFRYSKEQSFAILGSSNTIGDPLSSILSLGKLDAQNSKTKSYDYSPISRFRFPQKQVEKFSNSAGAIGYKEDISKNLVLNSYIISQYGETNKKLIARNSYFNPETTATETLTNTSIYTNTNILGNLELVYRPNDNEEMHFNFDATNENNDDNSSLNSTFDGEETILENTLFQNETRLLSNLNWYKKVNENYILQTQIINSNFKVSEREKYLSNQIIFEQYFKFNTNFENSFILNEVLNREITELNFEINNYITVGKYSNLNARVGSKYTGSDLNSNIFVEQSTISSNNLEVSQQEYYIAPGFIFKNNNFTVETELNLKYRKSFLNESFPINPRIALEYKKKFGNEIKLSYQYKDEIPKSTFFYNNPIIENYNTISIGNTNLRSEKFHKIVFDGSYSKLAKGLTFYTRTEYSKYDRSIIFNNLFIQQTRKERPINTVAERYKFFARATLGKVFEHFKLSLTPTLSIENKPQVNNTIISQNRYTYYNLNLKAATLFTKFPNFEASYSKGENGFESITTERTFNTERIRFRVEKDYGNLQAQITYSIYMNGDSFNNNFDNLNIEASYDIKNSPWRINFTGENLLNDDTLSNSFFTDSFIREQQISRLPAIILLGVVYRI